VSFPPFLIDSSFEVHISAIFKPLLRANLFKLFHFHPKNMNMEDFHRKFIPKSCLPSDLGGNLESFEVLHEQNREKLLEMREYFLNE
jgi:hypothetical protein